jgi:hypothetical protein
MMRIVVATLLLILVDSCRGPERAPNIERIEMKLSGWSAVEVEINSRGEGRYQLSHPAPSARSGAFSLSPQQFAALVERLRPFQLQSVRLTEESVAEILEFRCPPGRPNVTDAGGFWIRWTSREYDHHYAADFGCDRERHRARNDRLRAVMESLPVPSHR